jgi:hypothetical protein
MAEQTRPFSVFHAVVIVLLAAVIAGDLSLFLMMFQSR